MALFCNSLDTSHFWNKGSEGNPLGAGSGNLYESRSVGDTKEEPRQVGEDALSNWKGLSEAMVGFEEAL